MSITSAKSGATGISLALENNFMEPIASTLVGSGGVNQITFNDIPQTYKHLQLRIFMRDGTANPGYSWAQLRLNGDTATNYSWHYLQGSGSAASVSSSTSDNVLRYLNYPEGAKTGPNLGVAIVDIFDYTNTNKYKTTRTLSGYDANAVGDGFANLYSGLWMSNTAVNSIQFINWNNVSFGQYSRFSLYGIKG